MCFFFFFKGYGDHRDLHVLPHSFPTRRSSDLALIGINNRDLKTFATRLDVSLDLRAQVPAGRMLVSESGIHTPADVARLRAANIHAFLVGEAFMRDAEPGAALRRLFY